MVHEVRTAPPTATACDDAAPATTLAAAVGALRARHPVLPLPGRGDTLTRWRVLAEIARADVCVAKVLEAHYDAQAILADLDGHATSADACAGELLAVWAAEPPDARVTFVASDESGAGVLEGTKAWCSGSDLVDAALVTAHEDGQRVLVHVDMAAAGIDRNDADWQAVGMARVRSGRVRFDRTPAHRMGAPGAYLQRPGFWHGGAGIAACWFGAAAGIADTLRTDVRAGRSPHAQAHLGAIDIALSATASLLREAAALIDARPDQPHVRAVTRVRSHAERAATEVIDRVGRALGPGPLCSDAAHARRCADLTTFLRQSHAEHDWAALGAAVRADGQAWTL